MWDALLAAIDMRNVGGLVTDRQLAKHLNDTGYLTRREGVREYYRVSSRCAGRRRDIRQIDLDNLQASGVPRTLLVFRFQTMLTHPMRVILAILLFPLVLFPQTTFARCDKSWEVTTLARTETRHVLLSEKNVTHQISSYWLRRIVDVRERIDRASGIYTRLLICNSDDANAFAWKAGDVHLTGITLGMIKLISEDYDAYAFLLGHENAHLVLNHSRERTNRTIGLGILQLLVGTALEVALQKNLGIRSVGSDLASLGNQAISANYSREDERDADRYGIQYAVGAGFDPEGAIRLHSLMGQSRGFLSTHPSSVERIQLLRSAIAELQNQKSQYSLSGAVDQNENVSAEDVARFGNGQIISIHLRLGYFIATQTGLVKPKPGMRVHARRSDEQELSGTVDKVLEGYFSVVPDSRIDMYAVGQEITFK